MYDKEKEICDGLSDTYLPLHNSFLLFFLYH